jgi:hypothetical protein
VIDDVHRRELVRIASSNRLLQTVVRTVRGAPDTTDKTRAFRRDVLNAIAADEFERTELAGVPAFRDQRSLLLATLRHVDPTRRVWVELGVGSGSTARMICDAARRLGLDMELHGFDSFHGLPEAWGEIAPAGTYAYEPPRLAERNVRLHAGWFADTVPAFARECEGPLGFVHVDCDLYSSTKTAFDALGPLLAPGTVLLFDEYWNYLEAPEHEMKALAEFVAENGLSFEYAGYNADYMQASVVLRETS